MVLGAIERLRMRWCIRGPDKYKSSSLITTIYRQWQTFTVPCWSYSDRAKLKKKWRNPRRSATSVADLDPLTFLPLDPGSRMNIPDYFSESLEPFFCKNTKFFDVDLDPGSFWPSIRDGKIRIQDPRSRIRHKHPESATLRHSYSETSYKILQRSNSKLYRKFFLPDIGLTFLT